jgi:protein TonB
LAAAAPLAVSLAAHAAVIAAVAAGAALTARTVSPRPGPAPVAVTRAADAPAPPLTLDIAAASPGGPPAPPASEPSPVALDTQDPLYRPYLSGVRARIWRRWEAPRLPAGRSARGSLGVEFALARSGALETVRVTSSSGEPALDTAALEAVGRAAPFPPVPAAIAGESLRVRARFVYE